MISDCTFNISRFTGSQLVTLNAVQILLLSYLANLSVLRLLKGKGSPCLRLPLIIKTASVIIRATSVIIKAASVIIKTVTM